MLLLLESWKSPARQFNSLNTYIWSVLTKNVQNDLRNILAWCPQYQLFATLGSAVKLNCHEVQRILGKLPWGNSKINMVSLNWCPPDTEIFSKRRKIYSVCVESLSMKWLGSRHRLMSIRYPHAFTTMFEQVFKSWKDTNMSLIFEQTKTGKVVHIFYFYIWYFMHKKKCCPY